MTQYDFKRQPGFVDNPNSNTSNPPQSAMNPPSGRSPLATAAGSYSYAASSSSYGRRSSYDTKERRGSYDTMDPEPEYRIISFRDTSQYSKGGISSCGLAAINSASRMLPTIAASREQDVIECLELEETATSIMSICSFWNSDEHLEVQDILGLPLFACHLETIEVQDDQCTPYNFQKLTRSLVANGPSAAIVTRAPEIVAVMNIPSKQSEYFTGGFRKRDNTMIIFDSHPRSEHPLGAAFLIFPNADSTAKYLSKLFEVDAALLMDPNNWQTQMLTRYSAHILKARPSTDQEELDAIYSANIRLLGVSVQMKEAIIKEEAVQSDLRTLRDKLEAVKEKRKQASKEEAEAEKTLQNLKRELATARDFADTLAGGEGGKPTHQPRGLFGFGSGGRPLPEDKDKGRARLERRNTDSKGKGRVEHVAAGQTPVEDETAEYDRVRLQRLGIAPSHNQPGRLEDEATEYERIRLQHLGIAPRHNQAARLKDEAAEYERIRLQRFGIAPRDNQPARLKDEAAEYERARLEKLGMSRPQDRSINLGDSPFSGASIRTNRNTSARAPVDDREVALSLLESERDDFERARQLQMEEDRKALEELRAMQAHDMGFECKICLDTWSLGNVAKVDECEHEICRDCMKNHIKAELDHKRWPILCPLCRAENQKSPGVIYRRIAELAGADEEMITTWNAVELAVVSVLIECPSCKKTANIDAKDFQDAEMLNCPHGCGAYWCKKCSQPAERGKRHTCNGDAEFERWRDENKDVKLCPGPGCKMPIQRTEGCRHMICIRPGCNTHFCDECGKMLVKSQNKTEIDAAVQNHYAGNCKLFEYDLPEE